MMPMAMSEVVFCFVRDMKRELFSSAGPKRCKRLERKKDFCIGNEFVSIVRQVLFNLCSYTSVIDYIISWAENLRE